MFPLIKARQIAETKVAEIYPFCEVVVIAGSIRREKYEVKDIEIVCIPKLVMKGGVDLFGADTTSKIVHPEFVDKIRSFGRIIKGHFPLRYMQIELKEKINLDLFMPQRLDFWRQVAIRTGSGDYSAKVIAAAWVRKGWCGTSQGLRLQSECEAKISNGKTTWKCIAEKPTLPPAWGSEKEFFDWLGVNFIHPKYRTV